MLWLIILIVYLVVGLCCLAFVYNLEPVAMIKLILEVLFILLLGPLYVLYLFIRGAYETTSPFTKEILHTLRAALEEFEKTFQDLKNKHQKK